MDYQNFDAVSLMQQAPANFISPGTMTGFQGYNTPGLAGSWMNMVQPTFRYGVGGVMNQPNNSGSLPGATTTLPTSPEQTTITPIQDSIDPIQDAIDKGVHPNIAWMTEKLLNRGNEDWKEQADYLFKKEEERAQRANRMGQWNVIMGSVLKDIPRALSEGARRRNMYIGDMLAAQKEAAREQSVGIQQALASAPLNPPARNYIRI